MRRKSKLVSKRFNKILAVVLSVVLVTSLTPAIALAEGADNLQTVLEELTTGSQNTQGTQDGQGDQDNQEGAGVDQNQEGDAQASQVSETENQAVNGTSSQSQTAEGEGQDEGQGNEAAGEGEGEGDQAGNAEGNQGTVGEGGQSETQGDQVTETQGGEAVENQAAQGEQTETTEPQATEPVVPFAESEDAQIIPEIIPPVVPKMTLSAAPSFASAPTPTSTMSLSGSYSLSGTENYPTAKDLTFNGENQVLVDNIKKSDTGSAVALRPTKGMTRYRYKVDDNDWTSNSDLDKVKKELKRKDAGTYTVSYEKQVGVFDYKSGIISYYKWETQESTSVTVTIKKADITASVVGYETLEANGSAQGLVKSSSTSVGTIYYSVNGGSWTTSPTGTAAGTYNVSWKVEQDNYNTKTGSFTTKISNKLPKITVTASSGLVYTGNNQQLLASASTDLGTLQFSLDNTNWKTQLSEITGKNAGKYTVYYKVAAGDTWDSYSNSIEVNIAKADLPANAVVKAEGLVYNGKAQKLADDSNLPKGCTAYYMSGYGLTSTKSESTNIPTETDVCTAIGHDNYYVYYRIDGGQNYNSKSYKENLVTYEQDFKVAINKAPIQSVTLSASAFTYDGTAKSATIQQVQAGKTDDLATVPSDQYTVSGTTSETAVGTYTVTVSANSNSTNFTGSANATWTINKSYKIESNALTIEGSDSKYSASGASYEFTGSAITPKIKVMADGTELSSDYYTVSGDTTKTNIGTNYTITVTGKGGYTGSASATWSITGVQLKSATLSSTEATYSGSAFKPTVTKVVDSQGNEVSSSNYEVSYEVVSGGNAAFVNAGSYKVVITAKENSKYYGSVEVSYAINKANLPANAVTKASNLVYNGKDQAVAVENLPEGCNAYYKMAIAAVIPTSETDEIPTLKDCSSSAHYYVYYRIDGGTNYNNKDYNSGLYNKDFETKIDPAPICSIEFNETTPFTYNGTAQTVSIKKVWAGKEGDLVECSSDYYTVEDSSVTSATNPGDYSVSVKAKSTSLNFTSSGSTTWTINKSYRFTQGALTIKGSDGNFAVNAKGYEWTGNNISPEIKVIADGVELTKGTDYEVVMADSTTTAKDIKDGYTIKVKGIGAYNNAANVATATWSITGVQLASATLSSTSATYSGNAFKPTVTVKDSQGNTIDSGNYSVAWLTSDGKSTDSVNAGSYKVVVTAKENSKYYGKVEVSYTINKASLDGVSVAAVSGLVYNGKAQALVTVSNLPTECKIYFKRSSSGGESTSIPTETNATGALEYYHVYYRIDGNGNYEDKAYKSNADFNIQISKASMDWENIVITPKNPTYTGSEIEVTVTAQFSDGTPLSTGEYTVCTTAPASNLKGTDVGEYTVYVNFNGSNVQNGNSGFYVSRTWKIAARDISSDASVTFNSTVAFENQNVSAPEPVVTWNSKTLEKGTDYDITSGTEATTVGKHDLTVTFKGNFKGTATGQWEIVDKGITLSVDTESAAYIAAPIDISQYITVKSGNRVLEKGTGYTLTIADGKTVQDKGEYNFTVTGVSPFTGSKNGTFKVLNAVFSEVSAANKTYDGSETTTLTVKGIGGAALTAGSDYEVVSWSGADAGDKTVSIKGLGNYEGATGSATFTINKANLPSDAVVAVSGLVYNGKAQNLVKENLPAGCKAYYKVGYVVGSLTEETDDIPTKTDVSTSVIDDDYYVYYRIDGGTNYNNKEYDTGTAGVWKLDFKVRIDPAPIQSVTLSATEFTYDGTAKSVAVQQVQAGKTGDLVTVPSGQYTVSGTTSETAVGTYTVTVSANSDSTNFKDSANATWTINKSYKFLPGALTIKGSDDTYSTDAKAYGYNGKDFTPNFQVEADGVVLTKDVDYEVVAADSTTTAKDKGTYTIKVKGKGDYDNTDNVATATWSIAAAELKSATLSATEHTYNGTDFKPTVVEVKDINGAVVPSDYYTYVWQDANGGTTAFKNAGSYKVVITAKDGGNYAGSIEVSYTINKADLPANAVTKASNLVYNGKDQAVAVENLPEGCNAYYKIALGYVPAIEETDAIPTIKDHTLSAHYYVYYRINGGTNYKNKDYNDGVYAKDFEVKINQAPIYSIEFNETLPFTYNGTAQSVSVKKVWAGKEGDLVECPSDYYTVEDSSVTSATNPSDYTVSVKAKDSALNFTGSKSTTWTINKSYKIESNALTIKGSDGNYSASGASYEFKGSAITPDIKVMADGAELSSEYYTVTGDTTKTNVGTNYTITVTGKGGEGGYTGSASATWTITNVILVDGNVSLSWSSKTYNKASQIPDVTVVDKNGITLTQDAGFTLAYKDASGNAVTEAINAGTYTAVITGIGDYDGTVSKTWTINKADLPTDAVTAASGLVYNGKDQNLVTENLPEGCNAYYIAGLPVEIPFKSEQDAIPTAKNSGGDAHYYVYYRIDGGTNYNNKDYSYDSTTGIIKVHDLEVKINPAPIYSVEFNETLPLIYNGTDQTVSIKKVWAGKADDLVECPVLSYVPTGTFTGKAVDTYTIKITAANLNFTGSKEFSWTINKSYKFLPGALTIKGSDGKFSTEAKAFGYNGKDFTPEIQVEADGVVLTKDVDYEVVAADSTTTAKDKGTYTIKVKGINDYANADNVATATWSIAAAELKSATLSSSEHTYDGTDFKPTVAEVKDNNGDVVPSENYTYVWQDANGGTAEFKNAGSYKVVITAKEDSNYIGTIEVSYKVNKASLSDKKVKAATGLVYDRSPHSIVDLSEFDNIPGRDGISFRFITFDQNASSTVNGAYAEAAVISLNSNNKTGGESTAIKTNAGNWWVVYAIDGGQNYEDVKAGYLTNSTTITDAKIAKATPAPSISVYSTQTSDGLTYTGSAQQLVKAASVDYGTLQLNYKMEGETAWRLSEWVTVNTADDLKAFVGTDAGKYLIGYKVAEEANWVGIESGSTTYPHVEVTIAQKEIQADWITLQNLPWTGEEQSVEITVTDPDLHVTLVEKTATVAGDYTVSGDRKATAPGEYTVTITGTRNYTGSIQKTWKIIDLKAVLDVTEFDYDGTEHAVVVTVSKVDGGALIEGEDFIVLTQQSTFKATDAGTYKVYVKGLDDYADAGTVELTWTIKPATLAKGDLVIVDPLHIYTGEEHEVETLITHKLVSDNPRVTLVEGTDFEYVDGSVFKATDSGEYTITIKGINNYSGQVSANWIIQGIPMSHVFAMLDQDIYEYSGVEYTPEVKVGLLDTIGLPEALKIPSILTEGEDYVITGTRSATEAGTYEIHITGKGLFYGTTTLKYTINPRNLSKCVAFLINSKTGLPCDVHEYVDLGSLSLTYEEDIYIIDINLINQTDNAQLIKVLLDKDYATALEELVKGTTPKVAVLKNGTDYTTSGTMSKKSNEKGVYYISATGKGNYTGKVTKEWVIALQTEMVKNDYFKVENDGVEYSGKEITPKLLVQDTLLSPWTDVLNDSRYIVTDAETGTPLKDITKLDAGTYTLHIQGVPEKGKYGSQDITWTINKKTVTVKYDKTETTYDGTVQRPALKFYYLAPDDVSKVTVSPTKAIALVPPEHAGTYYMYTKVEFADDFNRNNYTFKMEGTYDTYSGIDLLRTWLDKEAAGSTLKLEIKEKIDEILDLATEDDYFFTKFVINPREVGIKWGNTEFTYNGFPQVPEATATNVVEGDYCELIVEGAQTNANAAGEHYTATVKDLSLVTELIGDYTLSTENRTCDFTIAAKDLGNKSIVGIEKLLDVLVYNTDTQKPEIRVTDLAAMDVLTEGKDYVIDTTSDYQAVNAGEYTLKIKGINNYSGEREVTWKILPKSLLSSDVSVALDQNQFVYDATEHKPVVQASFAGVKTVDLVENTDFTVSGTTAATDVYNIFGIGDYTMYVHGKGNYTGTVKLDWDIEPLDIGVYTPTITFAPKTFNGGLQMPEATKVVANGLDITDEVAFSLDSAAINAGTHDATLGGGIKLNKLASFNVVGTYETTWVIAPKEVTEASFTIDMGTYTYNMKDQTVDPLLVDKDTKLPLIEGKDYKLTAGQTYKDAGTYTVSIEFINNYSGAFDKDWTIKQANVANATVLVENWTYDTAEKVQEPQVLMLLGGQLQTLTADVDYEIDLTSDYKATNAGEYTLTIKGIDNFTGTKSADWEIYRKSLLSSDVSVELSAYQLVYNGKDQGPTVSVTFKGNELVPYTGDLSKADYYVSGTTQAKDVYDILHVTDYTMYIYGTGNYCGVVQRDWDIIPLDLSKVADSDLQVTFAPKTYNGKLQMPVATKLVVNGNEIPLMDIAFTPESARISAGEHHALLVGNVALNKWLCYNVVGAHEVTWEIARKQIEDSDFTFNPGEYTYNAQPQTVVPQLKDKNMMLAGLVAGEDYELTAGQTATDADTYDVTINFLKNYVGTAVKQWTIKPASIKDAVINVEELTFNGKGQKPELTVTMSFEGLDDAVTLVEDQDFVLLKADQTETAFGTVVNVGEYDMVIKGINNYTGTRDAVVKVNPLDISDTVDATTVESLIFTNKALEPEVDAEVVLPGDVTATDLVLGQDYTLEYKDNVAAGTASIVLTFIGNYTGTATITFEIKYAQKHQVVFYVDGVVYETQDNIPHGGHVTRPANPVKGGFVFAGWVISNAGAVDEGEVFLFDSELTHSIELTAQWIPEEKLKNVDVKTVDDGVKATSDVTVNDITLTDEEEAAVAAGAKLDVVLKLSKVENASPEEQAAITALLTGNQQIAAFLDISIEKFLNGILSGNVHETLNPVTITITIPEDLRVVGRLYSIVRVHNGVASVLVDSLEADENWNISFSSDRFSTYAMVIDDSNVAGDTPEQQEERKSTVSKTGDATDVAPWALLALVCAGGVGVSLRRRKDAE